MGTFIVAISLVWLLCTGGRVLAQSYPPPATVNPTSSAGSRTPAAADTSTPPAVAAPLYARLTAFAIPFTIDKHDGQAREVLLYVSADRGAHWTMYGRQAGPQGSFPFRAARDGEYWFTSRTVSAGTTPPVDNTLASQLRMVIDTLPPRLTVRAVRSGNGEIQVMWEAADEALAGQTLKVESQAAGETTWHPVPSQQPAEGSLPTLVGQTSFRPETPSRQIGVRVEISDRAGNTAQVLKQVTLPQTAAAVAPRASVPDDPWPHQGLPASTGAARPAESPTSRGTEKSAAPPAPRGEAWPGRQAVDKATAPDVTASSPVRPASPAETRAAGYDPSGATAAAATATNPAPEAGLSPAARGADSAPTGTPSVTGLPPGERPRMTNAKRFNLAYSVDAVGVAGVEKVELWITRNGGRDWNLWGVDQDKESPLEIELENEGIYGFRIVIVGKNGLASQTPRPGDLADLWVGVDVTKPVAEITSAAYGSGPNAGHLEIRWKAVDDHLVARPITLQFSDKPAGPWTSLAAGLPNTGEYSWRVDSSVPEQFYLRIEARDEAGNVATYRLDKPVASAGLSPKGHIRGVEPPPEPDGSSSAR